MTGLETRINPTKMPVQAFMAESEDGSKQSVGAVEAKPLPAQAATVPVPQAAAQELLVQSMPDLSIEEVKPLPAKHTAPPAHVAPAAEVRAHHGVHGAASGHSFPFGANI